MNNKLNNGSTTTGTDWWLVANSRIIWLLVLGLFIVMIWSSQDFSKSYFNLSAFGPIQLALIAFMIFLLLYRNISKIKIGNIEIETREAVRTALLSQKTTLKAMENILGALPQGIVMNENINNARNQINEARETIEIAQNLLRI